jgi:cytochrome c oxidase subunit 3
MSERLFETSGLLDMHDGHVLVDSSRFAVLIGLAIDVILFAGLLGAYLVLRASSPQWPPPELSHFRLAFPLGSAAALWLSAVSLIFAIRAQTANQLGQMRFGLLAAILVLMVFLGLNGSDWVTVIRYERVTHTLFGGIYFMVTGIFHIHIVAGMTYIALKLRQVLRWKQYTRSTLSIQHLLYFFSVLAGIWVAILYVVYP